MSPLRLPARFLFTVLPVLAALPPAATRAEPLPISLRMAASTTWAENISRTSNTPEARDSLRHDAQLTASLLQLFATGFSLIAELEAGEQSVPRYVRNTTFTAGARVTLRKKFGLGAFVPVLAAEGALTRRDARIPGETAWLATGALTLSQRFTEAWRAAVTGDSEQAWAVHAPFDTRHQRLHASVTWDATDTWQLTAGGGRLWGDFTAQASGRTWARALSGQLTPAIASYYNTVPYETTDSYGPGWVSYRVHGHSDFWWLGLAPALGPNTSLPLRYESSRTVNRAGVVYRQELWTLGLLHRF